MNSSDPINLDIRLHSCGGANTPSVSVIIPSFNRGDLIERAVRSVLDQDYPNLQIIVADDGSTDGTRERLSEAVGIEYYWQENSGPSAARHLGLRPARGQYVAMLDADDFWNPGYLRSAVEQLDLGRVDFTFSNWEIAGPGATPEYASQLHRLPYVAELKGDRWGVWTELSTEDTRNLFIRHSPAPSSGMVIRRDLVSHGWNEALRIGEDWLLVLGAILKHRARGAFTFEKGWTKWIDDRNICDCNTEFSWRAGQEVISQALILETYGNWLTPAEREAIKAKMAATYFDWGYHESRSGVRSKAVRYFMQSFAKQPALKPVAGLLKAMIRRTRI